MSLIARKWVRGKLEADIIDNNRDGSLAMLMENSERVKFRVKPWHHPLYGLVWQSRHYCNKSYEVLYTFDTPDLLQQEIMAIDWLRKHKKGKPK